MSQSSSEKKVCRNDLFWFLSPISRIYDQCNQCLKTSTHILFPNILLRITEGNAKHPQILSVCVECARQCVKFWLSGQDSLSAFIHVFTCLLVLTSIWILSPGWSSEQRSSSAEGWAAPAWRMCGAPHRPSIGFYRPCSSPCWSPAVFPGSHSVQIEEETADTGLLIDTLTFSRSDKLI